MPLRSSTEHFSEQRQVRRPEDRDNTGEIADCDRSTAFYSSSTGQKILHEMPAIMSEAMESMMPIMRKSIERMTEDVQQQAAEMMKESSQNGARKAPITRN